MSNKELSEDISFRDNKSWGSFFTRISKYAFRNPKGVVIVVFATLASSIADVVFPVILLKVIDNILVPLIKTGNVLLNWHNYAPLLINYALWFVVVAIVEVFSIGLFFYFTGKMKEQISFDLRNDLFEQFHRLSFSFYDKHPAGWLVTRITTDIDRISDFIAWGFTTVVKGVALMVLYFIFMFIYNIPLSIIVLFAIPILLYLSIYFRSQILKYSREARKINSEMVSYFTENINGIEINKSTVQEDLASERMAVYSSILKKNSFAATNYSALFGPVVIFFSCLVVATVIVLGSYFNVVYQSISVGVLAAFFGYSRNLFLPIFDMSRVYSMAQSTLSAGERVFALLDESPVIVDSASVDGDFEPIKGSIELQNISFYYTPNQYIIRNLNLTIKAGESIALVGATGCGKSTIANIIGRFYEPVSGSVLIDGYDYKSKTIESFRKQVGVVLQNPYIFTGTILENILYGRENSESIEARRALLLINAYQLLGRINEKTLEDGRNLSVGEKQIISIARIIIKNPAIVIMDEATSALDYTTEANVQMGIEYLLKTRTSIVIAHRLSTIVNCNRILVIDKGEIVEGGSHQELLTKNGAYKKLYYQQFSKLEPHGDGI